MKTNAPSPSPLRGIQFLVHDAVDAVVDLVRSGHESASRSVVAAGESAGIGAPVRTVETVRMSATNGVLSAVSAMNRSIESASELVFGPPQSTRDRRALPMREDVTWGGSWWADAALGGLNGAVGDHLARRRNPLGAPMELRVGDEYFRPEDFDELQLDGPHIAVFVHGLAATEWSWVFGARESWGDPATCFGSLLQREHGVIPVWVRYNTGQTVAENGEALARTLAELVRSQPTLRRIDLFGHSMGGLVIRQAARSTGAPDTWKGLVREVFYFGSPHTGAPLARFARTAAGVLGRVDLPTTRIISSIIDGRSDGIKDLADGLRDDLALEHANHTFVSGTVTTSATHPLGWALGDLLVRRASAEGEHVAVETVPVSRHHRGGVLHHELQNHPAVFEIVDAAYR